MKLLKRLFKIVAVLAVVVIVLVVALIIFIGPIVKKAATTVGPRLLGVPVEMGQVSISPLFGKVRITNVRIGNPTGYSEKPVFALGEFRFDLDTWSLFGQKPIIVNEVIIRDLAVSYEVVKGVSNIDALQKNLPKSDKSAEVKQADPANNQPARKVIVEHFECRGGSVAYRAAITANQSVTMPLPLIEIRDIGKESDGVSPVEASTRILGEVASSVGKAVTQVAGQVVDAGGKVIDASGKVIGEAGNLVGDGAKAAGDGAKAVGDGVKGLFKNVRKIGQ
jgi:uncharacterized protein involved in outer membrane biogenesis